MKSEAEFNTWKLLIEEMVKFFPEPPKVISFVPFYVPGSVLLEFMRTNKMSFDVNSSRWLMDKQAVMFCYEPKWRLSVSNDVLTLFHTVENSESVVKELSVLMMPPGERLQYI